jgi:hypothetical protein
MVKFTMHQLVLVKAVLTCAALLLPLPIMAQTPAIFKDADLAMGQFLIKSNNCIACHTQQVGGDGSGIYRPLGRINTAGLLRGMVEQCNTSLGLSLFPEEVTAIAAVLNNTHYKFTD